MFLKLIARNIQMVYRTLKSIVLRPFTLARYKLASLTNISKILNKIPKFFAALLAKLKMKPEKREDYVDAGPVFIAKSLLVLLVLLIVGVPLLLYFLAWPWFVGMFLTARFYVGQPQLEKYNGRVEIYYEQKLEDLMYKGRLKNGKYTDAGEEFFKNGMPKYKGGYLENRYDGSGVLYTEDGTQLYKGGFKGGVYEGPGELLLQDGSRYKGDFSAGKRTGMGQLFLEDKLNYDGEWKDDKKSGNGKLYADGVLAYEGTFAGDIPEGEGTEYFKNGTAKYKGSFKGGLYSGKGILYGDSGGMLYEGSFERGLFSGDGRYYGTDGGLVYSGTFVNGLYDGTGKLISVKDSDWLEGTFLAGKASGDGKLYRDGMLYYEGGFIDDRMAGKGTLTDNKAGLVYEGLFENNDIAYGRLFELPVSDIYTAFSKGLTEDTSGESSFYLYNQTCGLVMKLAYASETDPARLTDAYTRPQRGGITKIRGEDELKLLPGAYTLGKPGEAVMDADAARWLGLKQTNMKYYKVLYEGYDVNYWTDPATGEVVALQYRTSSTAAAAAADSPVSAAVGSGVGGAGGTASAGASAEAMAVFFTDLGLDIRDFASLGF